MSRKIKVLHLSGTTIGGAFSSAQRLHKALSNDERFNSKHLIFTGEIIEDSNTQIWSRNIIKKIYAFALHALDKLDFLRFEASKKMRFRYSHANAGIDISDHPWVQDADIIHFHWIHKGFLSFKSMESLLKLNKKFYWTLHDLWAVTGGCYYNWDCDNYINGCGNCYYLKNPNTNDLSKSVFRKKDELWGRGNIKFIAPSKWIMNSAVKSPIIKTDDTIQNIAYTIDSKFFIPLDHEVRRNIRLKYGFNDSDFVILFSAAILTNPAKGFHFFLDLAKLILSKTGARIKFLILGDQKGNEYDLEDSKFIGFVSDPNKIRDSYQVSDLYIITSTQDNFPNTIMESLSCGTPVVGFKIGGVQEMIDDNINGFVGHADNLEQLSNRIVDYIDNGNKEEFSKNARNKAMKCFDADVVVNKHFEYYQK